MAVDAENQADLELDPAMEEADFDAMIEVRDLTHYYGPMPAVENVNFTVRRGEILGFLGPNGAGKTTTMRILTGFMPPTRGTVTLDGYDVVEKSLEVRKRVGYLPESVPLHTEMTVTSYLKYMGTLRGMNGRSIRRRIDDVIDVCRLEDYQQDPYREAVQGFPAAGGHRAGDPARAGGAGAGRTNHRDRPHPGSGDPEPDPGPGPGADGGAEQPHPARGQHDLRAGLDHPRGHIVAADTPNNLAQHLRGVAQLEVEVGGPPAEVLPVLRGIEGATEVTHHPRPGVNAYRVKFREGLDLRDDISRTVVSNGWSLLSMQMSSMSLEEIFLRVTTAEDDVE